MARRNRTTAAVSRASRHNLYKAHVTRIRQRQPRRRKAIRY